MKQNLDTRTSQTMFGLILIAAIVLVLFLLFGSSQPPKYLVVDKKHIRAHWYTMRAQTGAQTVTAPAWQPEAYQVELLTDSAGKSLLKWLTVSPAQYWQMKKGAYLRL